MKKNHLFSALLFAAACAVAGCEIQRKSQSTGSGLEPSASVPSLVGTWASTSSAGTPSAENSSCTNFVWTITSQTDTAVAGTFSAVCLGTANITGSGTGQINGSSTVVLSISGNGSMPGLPSCAFALSGTGTIEGDSIRVPYSGSTCLGPVSGTQTLHRSLIQPTPTPPPAPAPAPAPAPPAPTPAPAPAPAPPPSVGDVLAGATIMNSPLDLGRWPITTTITRLELRPTGIHVQFSKRDGPGRWPDVIPPGWDEPVQYTLGMCLYLDSRWYCSAPRRFWHGLEESGGPPQQYAENWFYDPHRWGPMAGYQPAVGEIIGFFVAAGELRGKLYGEGSDVKERSNVVLVPMPGSGGANFTF